MQSNRFGSYPVNTTYIYLLVYYLNVMCIITVYTKIDYPLMDFISRIISYGLHGRTMFDRNDVYGLNKKFRILVHTP